MRAVTGARCRVCTRRRGGTRRRFPRHRSPRGTTAGHSARPSHRGAPARCSLRRRRSAHPQVREALSMGPSRGGSVVEEEVDGGTIGGGGAPTPVDGLPVLERFSHRRLQPNRFRPNRGSILCHRCLCSQRRARCCSSPRSAVPHRRGAPSRVPVRTGVPCIPSALLIAARSAVVTSWPISWRHRRTAGPDRPGGPSST